jgi:prepilin-type N-terminal cleavage/methylation domain-containing protein
MLKTKSGFTIVELLIVIVVIGILAAISLVAYNGVQARAISSQQEVAAKAYYTAFSAYVAERGSYPSTGGPIRICLGIDVAVCTTSTTNWSRSTNVENELKTIISTLPVANASIPLVTTPKMAYVPRSDITLDGVTWPFLIYNVLSPATCKLSGLVSGTWPSFSSTVPSQGFTNSEANGVRICIIALPQV